MIPPRRPRNPTLLPQAALAPPALRSRQATGLAVAAAQGRFMLQVCDDCGRTCYPPREACNSCLGANLHWRDVPPGGVVSAQTTVRISMDPYFRPRTPWRIGTVRLDCGPVVEARLGDAGIAAVSAALGDPASVDVAIAKN